MLFYPPIAPTPVPDPVPVSAASVDGDNDIRMDSDSNSGDKVSEVCGADGACTEGDEDRMDHAHTDQKDRTRTSGDTVKKEDASTGSSNRNNFSAELLEGIKPLTHMDRVVTNIAERFRGRYRHLIHFDLPSFPSLLSVVCVFSLDPLRQIAIGSHIVFLFTYLIVLLSFPAPLRLIFIRIPATEHSLIQFFGLQQGLLPQVGNSPFTLLMFLLFMPLSFILSFCSSFVIVLCL